MGNPSQVTTHNLQQSRHIRKKKKEALKSLRKVTLKIEPKVRVSNSSSRTAAAALQQFQLFSAAADAAAALLCSQFCSNHPSIRLGYLLLRVYTPRDDRRRPSACLESKGSSSQSQKLFASQSLEKTTKKACAEFSVLSFRLYCILHQGTTIGYKQNKNIAIINIGTYLYVVQVELLNIDQKSTSKNI